MIIYRPHHEMLEDAMADAKEFDSIEEMKRYIVENAEEIRGVKPFSVEDIVIGEYLCEDYRIGWKDVRHVCVKRYFDEEYSIPQCIGYCATEYGSMERTQRMCREFMANGTHIRRN